MQKIQRILVPMDFSEYSREALRYACELARLEKASLMLMHSYHVPAYLFPDGIIVSGNDLRADILADLETNLDAARKEALASGVSQVDAILVEGTPFVQIVRTARHHEVNLIVMGTHGYTGLKHALLGSVTEKVLRKAPCSVLTVRHPDLRMEHS